MKHAKDSRMIIANLNQNDLTLRLQVGKSYVYFFHVGQIITSSHALLIALFLILSVTPLVQSQGDKKGMANPPDSSSKPGSIKELIRSGMPYVVISPEQGEEAKKRNETPEDDSMNFDGDYSQYYGGPSNNMGEGHRMDKRYRYVGKRLRDRYRMAFGLGKRQDMRYAFGTETNNQNRQLLPFHYYLGPLREQRRNLGSQERFQGEGLGRFKRPVDRYRTFFGLGK